MILCVEGIGRHLIPNLNLNHSIFSMISQMTQPYFICVHWIL